MKKILFIFSVFFSVALLAQIQKVEPEFWWKGMKNPELQILLYGKDIAKYTPELSDGVQIKNLTKVENPNYLFLTVNTEEISVPEFVILLKNGKKTVASYRYELKNRRPGSAQRKSFTSADVFYLIMPDRFANGDPSNDTVPGLTEKSDRNLPNGRHGGDLKGIMDHLDYIRDLGATTVWLTPVCEDNEKQTTYHGYAQTDLYRIDARYGSNEDYRELSKKLREKNMKLVMDYVTNHWGSEHWMIKDLPSKDWIHYFDNGKNGFVRSNYKTSTQSDTNASKADRRLALDGWFDTTMPDINQSNPLVLKYIIQNAIWWIEYADLGGLRVDTYPYNDKVAMAQWAKAITDEYPDFNIVGETWLNTPAHIAFWQKDSKIGAIENYNAYLPSVMDFTLFGEMPSAFKNPENWNQGLIELYNGFSSDFLFPDVNNMMVFFENHDTDRWNEIFDGNVADYRLAMAVIATVRGIPQLYYGSEIGMRGDKSKGDADIRRDFPGGWKGDAQNAFSPAGRTEQQNEFYDFTRKLLNWRKNKTVIHNGKTTNYIPQDGVFVYFRYNDHDKVMVVLNKNNESKELDLSRFSESMTNISSGTDAVSGKKYNFDDAEKITVPAKTPLIIELY